MENGYNFTYCQNPDADVPKMFIDKEVGGKDEDGNANIDGSIFMKELYYLSDVLCKRNIEVWINSPGGIVTEGMKIYTAILESKAKVDTYCYGMAASIAGVIFQAGRTRCMLDFSTLMYHNPYNDGGEKDKGLEAIRQSIITMIAKRTGKDSETISKIMKRETWILAEEAVENGFCDEIRHSDEKNKKQVAQMDVKSRWALANKIYNRVETEPKTKKMKTVLNKLGLSEEASEASVLKAISDLEALNKKSIDEVEKKYNDVAEECNKLKAELEEMKKAKAKADEEAKAKADEEEAKNKKVAEDKADEDVKNLVSAGRIKNDADTIATFKNLALTAPEAFKNIVEALPVNKTAPSFNKAADAPAETEAEKEAKQMGLKVGSAAYYNHIKTYELKTKK